jgi:hypothetical protein
VKTEKAKEIGEIFRSLGVNASNIDSWMSIV